MSLLRSRITASLFRVGFDWLGKVWGTLRQLWHETTGSSAWKELRRFQHGGPLWRPLIVLLFMTLTIGFGITSFVRARRIR
jgi:hypothetical protein